MNLTNLFNFKYLKENIKKSKSTILLCILLIPIINGLILLITDTTNTKTIPTIYSISPILLLGVYVIPIVLSITLFNFIYKKGSIDFTLSLPISKKQIFLTNTIGGIVILLLMQIINLIILLIISLLSKGIILDYKMLIDVFVIYLITYTFVFTSCNIAISITSNKITTVIVTMLIIFLIPFISTIINYHFFDNDMYYNPENARITCTTELCKPTTYECYEKGCLTDATEGTYIADIKKIDNITYTLPYELIKSSIFAESATTNIKTPLIRMFILCIIYTFIGVPLFIRKKFEVVGISFKNQNMHIIVRTLTTIPIISISYIILKDLSNNSTSFFGFIFLLVLTIAYLIIYDLITRKKVTNFFKMLLSIFIVSASIVIIDNIIPQEDYNFLDTDIKSINIASYYSSNEITNIKDRELINYITSILLDTEIPNYRYSHLVVKAKIKSNIYQFYINVTKEQYDYIMSKIKTTKAYSEYFKKVSKYNFYAIGLNNNKRYLEKDDPLYKKIADSYKANPLENNNEQLDNIYNAVLYTYDNYQTKTFNFNLEDDKELKQELLNYYNKSTKKKILNKANPDTYSYKLGNTYVNSYEHKEISSFIEKELNEPVNINKEYKCIEIYQRDNIYLLITNDVNSVNNFTQKLNGPTKEEIINEEY